VEQSSGWLKMSGARAARAACARSLGLAVGVVALIVGAAGCGGSDYASPAHDAAVSIPSVTVPEVVAEGAAASGQSHGGKKKTQRISEGQEKASAPGLPSPPTTGGRAPADDKSERSVTSSSGDSNRAPGDDKGERTGSSSSGGDNRAPGDDKGER